MAFRARSRSRSPLRSRDRSPSPARQRAEYRDALLYHHARCSKAHVAGTFEVPEGEYLSLLKGHNSQLAGQYSVLARELVSLLQEYREVLENNDEEARRDCVRTFRYCLPHLARFFHLLEEHVPPSLKQDFELLEKDDDMEKVFQKFSKALTVLTKLWLLSAGLPLEQHYEHARRQFRNFLLLNLA